MLPKPPYKAFQRDGNLVVYSKDDVALWSSQTSGRGATLKMQDDGNLVIRDRNGNSIWSSGTYGNPGAYDEMGSDGNYAIWSKQ